MKVFLIYEIYYDYCNQFETLLEVFTNEIDAELYKIHKEEHNNDEMTWYAIRSQCLKSFDGKDLKDM